MEPIQISFCSLSLAIYLMGGGSYGVRENKKVWNNARQTTKLDTTLVTQITR